MKKDRAQSLGLRRWRVDECSSRASARGRFCVGADGGGSTTLLLGLPPGYTSSIQSSCSLIMKPPKNVFLAEIRKKIKKTERIPRNSIEIIFCLPGHGGVSEADSTSAGKTGGSPFLRGSQSLD